VNILLFGQFGSGKSSFINTVVGAMNPGLPVAAIVGGNVGGHITTQYGSYEMTPCITLWDTWGWSKDNYSNAELEFMLDGWLPDKWDASRVPTARTLPRPLDDDVIHCIIFTVPASAVDDVQGYIVKLGEFLKKARTRELQALVILTKLDLLDPSINSEPMVVFSSPKVQAARTKLSQSTGIPESFIIPVRSYHNQLVRSLLVERIALFAIDKALGLAAGKLHKELELRGIDPRKAPQGGGGGFRAHNSPGPQVPGPTAPQPTPPYNGFQSGPDPSAAQPTALFDGFQS